jgi:hypothetical protein
MSAAGGRRQLNGDKPEFGILSNKRKRPTNPFLPGSVVWRPVSSGFPIPHGVCLMVRLEQVWHERISWLQSSGLTVAAGDVSRTVLTMTLPNGVVIHVSEDLDGQRLGDGVIAAGQIPRTSATTASCSEQVGEVLSC